MKKYTVLGEDVSRMPFFVPLDFTIQLGQNLKNDFFVFQRWSMTMMVLSEGRIQKLVRDLDSELTGRVIRNAVDSL